MEQQMREKELAETLKRRLQSEEQQKRREEAAELRRVEEARRYRRSHEEQIDAIVRREMEALNPQELKLRNFL